MKNFIKIKDRVKEYIDLKGISHNKFYEETRISNGILSQKNGLSEENLLKIITTYREISLNWLLLGIGEMISNNVNLEEMELLRENRELRKQIDFLRMKIENMEKSKKLKNNHDSVCKM